MAIAASSALTKVLAFSAAVEFVTGVSLAIAPTLVVAVLLGPVASAGIAPVGRIAGIALIALGLACWPGRDSASGAAFRALLAYNVLVAACLFYLGVAERLTGLMLWPAVAAHVVVAGLLLFFRESSGTQRQTVSSTE